MSAKSTHSSKAPQQQNHKTTAPTLGNGFDRSALQKDLETLYAATEGSNTVDSKDKPPVIKSLQRMLNAINSPDKKNENWQEPKLPLTGKIAGFTQKNIKAFQESREDIPDSGRCDRKTVEGFAEELKLTKPPSSVPHKPEDAERKTIEAKKSSSTTTLPIPIERVSKAFPEAKPSDIQKYYPLICKELNNCGIKDPKIITAAIANLKAETCTFRPITERPSRLSDKDGEPKYDYSRYDNRLGNRPGTNDAERFCGRGFIQLTGRSNYEEYGKKIAVDLISNPELANDPRIAAKIFAAYIADKKDILASGDLQKIRRAINGGQNGKVAFQKAFNTLSGIN